VIPLLILGMSACSDDVSAPEEAPNTPEIPTVDHPQDELPAQSEFLSTNTALLGNFSPKLDGLAPSVLDELNSAYALEFRLEPSRNLLVSEGQPCHPSNLQWKSINPEWLSLDRATVTDPFVFLGENAGSHYYMCRYPANWIFANLNCELLGGHLVSLTSADEHQFVVDAMEAAVGNHWFFIGLTDYGRTDNDWIWTSGEPYGWSNWRSGQPSGGSEAFVHTWHENKWNDTNFTAMHRYIAELPGPLLDAFEGELPCADRNGSHVLIDGIVAPSVIPYIERQVYWKKVFQITLGAGSTYSQEHSYTYGTSETTGLSFGWSIGTTVTSDWGVVSAEIETEFHMDFDYEFTVNRETTYTDVYEGTAPDDKTMVLALWQLRERFYIVDSEGNDWNDPRYVLAEPVPYLDQGLEQEYLQTIHFDQP
jgi:hypothetical protein